MKVTNRNIPFWDGFSLALKITEVISKLFNFFCNYLFFFFSTLVINTCYIPTNSIFSATGCLILCVRCLTSVDIFPTWSTAQSCRHTPAAAASPSLRCRSLRSSTPGWPPEPGSHPVTRETTGPSGWCNSQTCFPAPRWGEGPPWIVIPESKTRAEITTKSF